ncbi:MAG: polyprenyltransferase, partial [Spirosomataceae bacterium]
MKTYLQLIRPANIVTAVADILAGISLSGFVFSWQLDKVIEVGLLIAATKMLYAGGIVFNDVFDAELDAIER